MKKRIPLLILLALLAYVFWISSDFAMLAAGVSIFLFGTVATALTQSSSVISVITISFLSAGLLALMEPTTRAGTVAGVSIRAFEYPGRDAW